MLEISEKQLHLKRCPLRFHFSTAVAAAAAKREEPTSFMMTAEL